MCSYPSIHYSMGSAPVGVQYPFTSSLGEFPDYWDWLWHPEYFGSPIFLKSLRQRNLYYFQSFHLRTDPHVASRLEVSNSALHIFSRCSKVGTANRRKHELTSLNLIGSSPNRPEYRRKEQYISNYLSLA